jgi:hypothetical protein
VIAAEIAPFKGLSSIGRLGRYDNRLRAMAVQKSESAY